MEQRFHPWEFQSVGRGKNWEFLTASAAARHLQDLSCLVLNAVLSWRQKPSI